MLADITYRIFPTSGSQPVMINSFTESYFTPRSTVALLRTYTGATTDDRVLVLSIFYSKNFTTKK